MSRTPPANRTTTRDADETTDDTAPGRRRFLRLAGATALAATGLGATAGGASAAPKSATVKTAETADGFAFSPQVIHVRKGGTVTWTVPSSAHTVTTYSPNNSQPRRIPKGATGFDSGFLTGGQTFSKTFSVEGVYDYYCSPHHNKGMVGCVVVGNPNPAKQPAMKPPQASLPDEARVAIKQMHEKARKKAKTATPKPTQTKTKTATQTKTKQAQQSTPTQTQQSTQTKTQQSAKTQVSTQTETQAPANTQTQAKTQQPTKTETRTATPEPTASKSSKSKDVDVESVLDGAERVRVRDEGDEKRLRVRWADGRRVRIEIEEDETEVRTRGDVDHRVVKALVEWLKNH